MKVKLKYDRKSYTIPDYYLSYKNYIELDSVYDVDFKTFKNIVTDYFKYIRDEIMLKSKEVKLPFRMGTLLIIKHLPKEFTNKSLRWDWKSTKELGKPVYYLNEHSGFYKYRFFWCRLDCNIPNKSKYMFIASRANKRNLCNLIKSRTVDYVEK